MTEPTGPAVAADAAGWANNAVLVSGVPGVAVPGAAVACELTAAALKTKDRRIIRKFFMADQVEMRPIVQAVGLTKRVSTGSELLTILEQHQSGNKCRRLRCRGGSVRLGQVNPARASGRVRYSFSGKVHLDGEDIFSLDEDARAALRGRVLGFVFQSFQLLPALTASRTSCCRWSSSDQRCAWRCAGIA